MKKKHILLIILIPVLLLAVAGAVYYSYSTRVYKHCVIECGSQILAEDFLKKQNKTAEFVAGSQDIDTTIPGDYDVIVKSGIFTYECSVTVQDTIAPVVESQKKYIEMDEQVTAEDFLISIQDISDVTIAFANEPDYSIYGEQPITICVTDLGGNKTYCDTSLIIRATKYELIVEAGSAFPEIGNFLLNDDKNASFVTPVNEIDMNILGEHEIEISANESTYTTMLHVVDTTAPTLELKPISIYTFESVKLENFIVSSTDVTALAYAYVKEPDFSAVGAQDIIIRATDTSGNITDSTTTLTLLQDTDLPTISGAKNLTVFLGGKVNYKKGVTVHDATDSEVSLKVDNGAVNLKVIGDYPVTYTAKDRSGNVTTQTITLSVKERVYTEAEIYALADKALKKIIKPSMTEREKLDAIYKWVRANVKYINYSDKSDWKKAAYEGFVLHKGDCYVYASISKALLTRAGITNKDIKKIPDATSHFWNLVDIGEGWYHFDTTARRDKSVHCYESDASLMAYSAANGGTHNYDKTVYTDIK